MNTILTSGAIPYISMFQGLGDFSIHSVELDMEGLVVRPPSFTYQPVK